MSVVSLTEIFKNREIREDESGLQRIILLIVSLNVYYFINYLIKDLFFWNVLYEF